MTPPPEAQPKAPERPSYEVRGAVLRNGDTLTGWCWSPERGSQRLRVSLVIDGCVAGTTIAARLQPDLVRHTICDGRHGFCLSLPTPLPPFSLLEMREWATGQVFGRIVSDQMADLRHWRTRVETLAGQTATLQLALAPPASGSRRLAEALKAVGTSLQTTKDAHSPDCLPSGLRLPQISAPALTLLLPVSAADSAPAAACVQTLAPLLRYYDAELILADTGHGRFSAAFAHLPGLLYCQTAATGAARLNLGARYARSPVLVVLRPQHLRIADATAILENAASSRLITLGGHATLLARQAGLSELFDTMVSRTGPAALILKAPVALLERLGGLDHGLEDGDGLSVLDFALRARHQGHAVTAWHDPGLAIAPSAPAARCQFAVRWSRNLHAETPASVAP